MNVTKVVTAALTDDAVCSILEEPFFQTARPQILSVLAPALQKISRRVNRVCLWTPVAMSVQCTSPHAATEDERKYGDMRRRTRYCPECGGRVKLQSLIGSRKARRHRKVCRVKS